MFICINGQLGSGKSTICKLLNEMYGFEVFSTGTIQRKIAIIKNMSTLELNKESENDYTLDYNIDDAIVEFANKNIGEPVVFDSRLAWYFVPNSFKVRLTINPVTAAERIVSNRRNMEESYDSLEEAISKLSERQKSESLRYKSLYNVDIDDSNNYDLIVDTSQLTPEEVVGIIYEAYCYFCKKTIEKHIMNQSTANAFINTAIVAYDIRIVLYKMQNGYVTSVDEILNNEISTFFNKKSERTNMRLIEEELLVIDSFETCNGKEETQKLLYEIITKRMQLGKLTFLISNMRLKNIPSISSELISLITDSFEILP